VIVVPEGTHLTHYFRDNAKPNGPWQRGPNIRGS
jgi:hypothetical protein